MAVVVTIICWEARDRGAQSAEQVAKTALYTQGDKTLEFSILPSQKEMLLSAKLQDRAGTFLMELRQIPHQESGGTITFTFPSDHPIDECVIVFSGFLFKYTLMIPQ